MWPSGAALDTALLGVKNNVQSQIEFNGENIMIVKPDCSQEQIQFIII